MVSSVEEMQVKLVAIELTPFCLSRRKKKRHQKWSGGRVISQCRLLHVPSKERGTERRKIRNALHGDTECDQKSETDSFGMLLIGKSVFRSMTHILSASHYAFFSHVHTTGQCKWSNLRISIQVWKQVVCGLHKRRAIRRMALVWNHDRLWRR